MATIYERGGSKVLNWRQNGRQYRRSLGKISKKEAEAYRLAKEIELRQGPATPFLTVRALSLPYLEWYSAHYPANYDRTETVLRKHVLPVFGERQVSDLSIRDCELHMQARREAGAKRNTYIKDIRTLKAMLNKGVEWGMLLANPISALKYPRELDARPPRFYTSEELNSLYCASPYHWHWWKLLANTGLRRGEALKLRWEHVTDDALYIVSSEAERTKSGRWRSVSVNEAATQALNQFKKRQAGGYVFPRVNPRSMTRSFMRCVARADGVAEPKGSIHCLRHTYCSHLVMAGVPLTLVQKLAGHASYKTTERYAHVSADALTEAASSICL